MSWLLTLVVAFVLHFYLGWEWTLLAGVLAGLLQPRWGWLTGFGMVALEWSLWVFWSYLIAAESTAQMLDSFGGLGNLPAPAVVGATALVGGVLGLLGGWIGGLFRGIFDGFRSQPSPPPPNMATSVPHPDRIT